MPGHLVKGQDQDYWSVMGLVTAVTEKAVLVEIDGLFSSTWLPKSQLEDWPRKEEHGEILMTLWIAQQKGFV